MSNKTQIETDSLLERINNLRTEYKNENKKGFFSSKQYKFDCANMILKTIDLDTLLNSTLTILPNSYHLFFDYTVFKTFATPELFDTIISFVIFKISNCINTYGTYEMHINLNTFSVSAFHRYRDIIDAYSYEITNNNQIFNEKLRKMHIYYTPSAIDQIAQLLGPMAPENVIKYDKVASEKAIKTITEILQTTNQTFRPIVQSENGP